MMIIASLCLLIILLKKNTCLFDRQSDTKREKRKESESKKERTAHVKIYSRQSKVCRGPHWSKHHAGRQVCPRSIDPEPLWLPWGWQVPGPRSIDPKHLRLPRGSIYLFSILLWLLQLHCMTQNHTHIPVVELCIILLISCINNTIFLEYLFICK